MKIIFFKGYQAIVAAYIEGCRLIQRFHLPANMLQTLRLRTRRTMNLSQLVVLGVTSLLVCIAPISYAIAESVPGQAGLQNLADKPVTVAQTQTGALYSGIFAAGEAPTTGTARIVSEGGHRYLELDAAFTTSSQGPDLHVVQII